VSERVCGHIWSPATLTHKKKTPAQTKQGLVAPLFGVRADLSNASGDANLQFALMKQKY